VTQTLTHSYFLPPPPIFSFFHFLNYFLFVIHTVAFVPQAELVIHRNGRTQEPDSLDLDQMSEDSKKQAERSFFTKWGKQLREVVEGR
jgi:hypothetical protein